MKTIRFIVLIVSSLKLDVLSTKAFAFLPTSPGALLHDCFWRQTEHNIVHPTQLNHFLLTFYDIWNGLDNLAADLPLPLQVVGYLGHLVYLYLPRT